MLGIRLNLICVLAACAAVRASAAPRIVVSESGEGLAHVVTVQVDGLFRLGFENQLNYGLSQWFDLVHDPEATLDLAQNPGSGPIDGWRRTEQGALSNHVLYPVDYHANHLAAKWAHPDLARSIRIVEQNAVRCVIETRCHPVVNHTQTSDFTFVTRYAIHASGRIYVQTGIEATRAIAFKEWRIATIGIGDPSYMMLDPSNPDSIPTGEDAVLVDDVTLRVPGATWEPGAWANMTLEQKEWKTFPIVGNTADTITIEKQAHPLRAGYYQIHSDQRKQGWLRGTDTQLPYEWQKTPPSALFMCWDPATRPPFRDHTKASILVAAAPGHDFGVGLHGWAGFKRLYFTRPGGITLDAGDSWMHGFMIQLGTQQHATLPDIASTRTAARIAAAFRADPGLPFDRVDGLLRMDAPEHSFDALTVPLVYPSIVTQQPVSRVLLDGKEVPITHAKQADDVLLIVWATIHAGQTLRLVP